ncbi:hypothetical protein ACFQRB_20000 [Halobaculum litoreum]|uniref:Uncharacterized protein n=1 Tax=Halobaculum litoreum TaxID=3031998 RepID=A0ABD5XSI3_9EURY
MLRGLASVAAATGAGPLLAGEAAGRDGRDAAFDPTRHGFGFRNWGRATRYFDPVPAPERAWFRDRVRDGWREAARETLGLRPGDLPPVLVDAVATQLRTAVEQGAGTNGHCYGMVLTAQRYFDRPDAIPVDKRSASEIAHPTEPAASGEPAVYHEIVDRQVEQVTRFRSWLARRALLHPSWIDQAAVLRDVRAVVRETGTASVILFDGSLTAHQVLVHDVTEVDGGVRLGLYDPNLSARTHERRRPTLEFVAESEGPRMVPYDGFTGLLFTRYDQIDRATDRGRVGPFDHLRVAPERVREALFPVVQVTADDAAVDVYLTDPAGEPVRRLAGRSTARELGRTPRIGTCFGADPGEYSVTVAAREACEYTLRTVVADRAGALLDASGTERIGADEVSRCTITVPENGGDATVDHRRIGPGGDDPEAADTDGSDARTAVGAAGGVAAGVLGTRAYDRFRST